MQLSAFCTLTAALFCVHVVRDIDCVPTNLISSLKKENAKGQDLFNQSGQAVDEDVRELENLKPIEGGISVMKSHSSVFTDINGKKEGQYETKEELNKQGKLLARLDQKVKQEDDGSAPTPLTYVRTEIEVPHRGIHKVIENNEPVPSNSLNINSLTSGGAPPLASFGVLNVPGNMGVSSTNLKRKMFYPHGDSEENNININVEPYKTYSGVQFSPLDMAEYIFWTGDEKGVTLAIEEFLVEGLMTREEALSYLHDIRSNLDYLQKQYSEEQAQRESTARESLTSKKPKFEDE